jgi:fumarate hydratase class II
MIELACSQINKKELHPNDGVDRGQSLAEVVV